MLFDFVSRADKCAVKCTLFLSSSVDYRRKGVIFDGRRLQYITITIRLPAFLIGMKFIPQIVGGRAVITKAADFLPNFSFAHRSTVFFVHLNCSYKFGNRFGEVSEPKLKKTIEISWVFR